MWAELIKVASLSKGALVVGVAASAAMVSNVEISNAPSQHAELPAAAPIVTVVAALPAPMAAQTKERHGAVPQVVKDCVDAYLAVRELGDSALAADRLAVQEICKGALAATGLSSDEFWAKLGINDEHKTEPKTRGLEAAIKECVAQYRAGTADGSDACRKAIAASGLSPQEFWTKFGPYAAQAEGGNKPTEPKSQNKERELYALVTECLRLRNALTSTSEQERVSAASAACGKAIDASGVTPDEFWMKVSPKPAATPVRPATPKPEPKPAANADAAKLTAKCLDRIAAVKAAGTGDTKAVGEVCNAAAKASGMSSTDFWAKYHPATN